MSTDTWNGNGDWEATPANWSSGVPLPTTNARIQSGTASISNGGFGEAQSLVIDAGTGVSMGFDASLTISDLLYNVGTWNVGGGDTVSIGTNLTNAGTISIGGSGIIASTSVTAAGLWNMASGAITLAGNASSKTTNKATLDITDSNSAIVSGTLNVYGDADLELATGLTRVTSAGALRVEGQQAFVSLGAGSSNNALSGLTWNSGLVDFEGGSGNGYGGTTITTTAAFTNYGQLLIDASGGDGGSQITFGGTLVNSATLDIGNSGLGANGLGGSTLVKATALDNIGTLNILGNASSGTTFKATLNITGAAASVSTGRVQVGGDATLQFASGGISSIGRGGWLELDGSGAKVLSGAASGLSGLAVNHGSLLLRGGTNFGVGGATLTTTTSFINYGSAYLDGYQNGDGGSAATFGGTLTNDGTLDIGNLSLGASVLVKATTLVNNATFNLQGNAASETTAKASLILSGAAGATVTDYLRVGGDASLTFNSGNITTIVKGGWLELDGSGAQILTNGGAAAGLAQLATNNGNLVLRGDTNLGAGGVNVTTARALTNNSLFYIDAYGNGDAGSTVKIGGVLTNNASLSIGNAYMGASTTVSATTLSNNGNLILQGNASSGTTNRASLTLSGAAPSTSTGYVRVSGDALIQFGSGAIVAVGSGSWVELDGSQAQILANGASALAKLATNNGTLTLRGNTSSGAGGATLTTTTNLTNNNTVYVDAYSNGDSGSTLKIGGGLYNYANFSIGNAYMGASTTVSATTLLNYGSLTVQGAAASGATDLASLVISGAAYASLTSFVRVSGDGLIRYGSAGISSIGGGGWLELDGSQAQILSGAGTSSALAKLASNSGTLLLRGNTNIGAGGAALTTITNFTNNGTFYVDSYSNGDSASAVQIGGVLYNNANLLIGNAYMGASSMVSATTLSNGGSLTVQGNTTSGTTDLASLVLSGAAGASLTGFVRVGGDGLIKYGSGAISYIVGGAWLELDGSQAQILAGSTSALAKLSKNDGTLLLRGNSNLGSGGATLTTTSALTNNGVIYVDSYSGGDSGSSLTLGGVLANQGSLSVGNTGMGAATTMTVTSLSNSGSLTLVGSSNFLAKLVVNGTATNFGNINIGAGSALDVTGAFNFNQAGGTTTVTGSLQANALYANDGLLDFESAILSGDGVGALYIGQQGSLNFGSSVDSTHSVSFLSGLGGTLSLGDATAFAGKITGFASHDAIDLLGQSISGVSYSGGVLTASLSGGGTEAIAMTGSYTTSSFTLGSDGHGGTNILHT